MHIHVFFSRPSPIHQRTAATSSSLENRDQAFGIVSLVAKIVTSPERTNANHFSRKRSPDKRYSASQTQSIAMGEDQGRSDEAVIELLQQFDWNWHLVADHLDADADALKERFGPIALSHAPRPSVPEGPIPFGSSHIRPDHIARLQQFVRENLADSLPVLFDDDMPPEQREEITNAILLEMDFGYKLTHAPELRDAYKTLEDEAFLLAKWREQLAYLTVVEEAFFRVSVQLARDQDAARLAEERLERDE